MKKRILALTSAILLTVGCVTTLENTLGRTPLTIEFSYPYEDVWGEMYIVMTSSDIMAPTTSTEPTLPNFILEKGSIEEKMAWFRTWRYELAVVDVYLMFEKINDERTKVILRFNMDAGVIKIEDKVKHFVKAVNYNLMIKFSETKPRPYIVYDLKEWAKLHGPQSQTTW